VSQLPDFDYIRTKISIVAVARTLGIEVGKGYRARCWRAENHRNGDANPSLSFQVKKNRGMCFVCDPHTWSNIDLVMLRLECDMRAAVNWIVERFPVPLLPAGSHIKKREAWFPRYRSGVNENVMTLLVKSGIWSDLTHAEKSVLAVLITFIDNQNGYAETSYRGIMRYAGVGSQATVAKAIRRFEQMRVLRIRRQPGGLLFRGVNQYVLTIDDPEFDLLLTQRFTSIQKEIALEKELRAEAKRVKQRAIICTDNCSMPKNDTESKAKELERNTMHGKVGGRLKCKRCDFEWNRRLKDGRMPRQCPCCKSPKWGVSRVIP
jgi:hypothetical protein